MRGRKILAIKVALYVSKLKLKKSDSENGKTNIKTYHMDVNHSEQRLGIRKILANFFQCVISVSYTHLTLPTNREV